MKFIAKTFAGLEDILGQEIAEIGGYNIIKIFLFVFTCYFL